MKAAIISNEECDHDPNGKCHPQVYFYFFNMIVITHLNPIILIWQMQFHQTHDTDNFFPDGGVDLIHHYDA